MTFEWSAVYGASWYLVELSTAANFPDADTDTYLPGGTSYTVSGLAYEEHYYWRVRAMGGGGETSPWSSVSEFTTAQAPPPPPPRPVLSSPSSGATHRPRSLTLDWQEAARAERYRVQVSPQSDFSPKIVNATTTATSRRVRGLDDEQRYWWRVRAINDAGASPWSERWHFTTKAAPVQTESGFVFPAAYAEIARGQYGAERPFTQTRYEASPLGRVRKVLRAGDDTPPVTRKHYGVTGSGLRYVKAIDAVGDRARTYRDAFSRVVKTVRAYGSGLGVVTRFRYDALGRLTRVERPEGEVVTYRYDALGRLVAKATPSSDGDGDGDPTGERAATDPDTRYKYERWGTCASASTPRSAQRGRSSLPRTTPSADRSCAASAKRTSQSSTGRRPAAMPSKRRRRTGWRCASTTRAPRRTPSHGIG